MSKHVQVRVAAANALPIHRDEVRETTPPVAVPAPERTPEARWDAAVDAHPPAGEYLRRYRVRATAYIPIDTEMEGGRYTATERDGRAAHGIAVDPDMIPLGSHLWVPGYGHGIADDTGGRINGHRIDLRMQTRAEMDEWGVQRTTVYVLADP